MFDFRYEFSKITPLIGLGAKIFIFGTGSAFDSFQQMYWQLVGVDIAKSIDGFIDYDLSKRGQYFHNRPIYSLAEIDTSSSVIIIAYSDKKMVYDISAHLSGKGMVFRHSFFNQNCFMWLIMRWESDRLSKFKDIHAGKRCFIIGNGPSLRAEDLNRLKNEITFGTNRIYLLFDKTDYRPSYYMVHDDAILRSYHQEITKNISCPVFYNHNAVKELLDFDITNKYFYCLESWVDWQSQTQISPLFSQDPLHIYWGATITYDCIQMAVHMGFHEIYLLGVDMTYKTAVKRDGTIVSSSVLKDHFVEDNCYMESTFLYLPLVDIIKAAYMSAHKYADAHNVKIYNATRGGKLDLFERVDFDILMKE